MTSTGSFPGLARSICLRVLGSSRRDSGIKVGEIPTKEDAMIGQHTVETIATRVA